MGFYFNLLAQNDNRPIWQWEFSDQLIAEIKLYFVNVNNLANVDARDCTLFFAIWWKKMYSDGTPSKQLILEALNENGPCQFSAEEFYQKAKRGGRIIGLRWIQKDYTLYFRTLLLQGGLPIRNMMANAGNYRNFLEAIIELKPENIEDIANNLNIISLLPFSSRNEIVYATALNISIAIHNGEGDWYVEKLVAANVLTNDSINKAVHRYKNRHNDLIKIRPFWELNKTNQNNFTIVLRIDLPERMDKGAFASLTNINEGELKATYNFFSDENLVATYRKNLRGDFLKTSSQYHLIFWNPDNDQLPVLYFADNIGNKYVLQNKIVAMPSLVQPTLWIQMEENRWVMSQKNSYNGDSAFLMTAHNQVYGENHPSIVIIGQQLCFYQIKQTTSLQIDGEDFIFTLNTKSFDWFIQSNPPMWMDRSNMVVIKSLPNIYFYSDNGTRIPDNQVNKQWRKKGSLVWSNDFQVGQNIEVGIIELKFTYDKLSEYFRVFNIGDAELTFQAKNVLHPVLTFQHSTLLFDIKDSPLYTRQVDLNIISLGIVNAHQIPNHIKGIIRTGTENLYVELLTPRIGISIVDNDGNVLDNGHVFLLNNLYGYRIVVGDDMQTVKLYNDNRKELYISQEIKERLIPLQLFHEPIQRLFLLSDSMFANNRVIMQIGGNTFTFQAYNCQLTYKDEHNKLILAADGRLLLTLNGNVENDFLIDNNVYYKLKAIPLNCDLKDIQVIDLENNVGGYSFPENIKYKEFIVFDDNIEIKNKLLPTYVTIIQENIAIDQVTRQQNKINRIDNFKTILLIDQPDGDEWQKLNAYIEICFQKKLPFSAFDNLRAVVSSSELTARLFLFVACNAKNKEDFYMTCEKMEDELGFKFRWCAYESFDAAIEWVSVAWQVDLVNLYSVLAYYVEYKYLSYDPINWGLPNGFVLNAATIGIRQRLGQTVINELPTRRPWIEQDLKNIIYTDQERLKIIMRTPIAIALQKMNLYVIPENDGNLFSLWHVNNYEVRRNMMYCENLDLIWFETAIKYVFRYLYNNNLIKN